MMPQCKVPLKSNLILASWWVKECMGKNKHQPFLQIQDSGGSQPQNTCGGHEVKHPGTKTSENVLRVQDRAACP